MSVLIVLACLFLLFCHKKNLSTSNQAASGARLFLPQNQLERALLRVIHSSKNRRFFYKRLLKSQVYVLGVAYDIPETQSATTPTPEVEIMLKELSVQGERVLPVFSSLSRISEFSDQTEQYLVLTGGTLLETLAGEALTIHVNPGSRCNVEFSTSDVQNLIGKPD